MSLFNSIKNWFLERKVGNNAINEVKHLLTFLNIQDFSAQEIHKILSLKDMNYKKQKISEDFSNEIIRHRYFDDTEISLAHIDYLKQKYSDDLVKIFQGYEKYEDEQFNALRKFMTQKPHLREFRNGSILTLSHTKKAYFTGSMSEWELQKKKRYNIFQSNQFIKSNTLNTNVKYNSDDGKDNPHIRVNLTIRYSNDPELPERGISLNAHYPATENTEVIPIEKIDYIFSNLKTEYKTNVFLRDILTPEVFKTL